MRMNLLKFATCFAIGAAVLVACEQTEMEPVFPDEIITDADVNTTSEVIEFTANLDWELSLPMETISFFWLEDEEGNKLNKLSGKAGTYKVNVGITDEPDFDNDVTCDITLTMGDKSKVIATYTLLKSVKEFKAYPCQVEDGAFKYRPEGGFAFSETSATSVELIYSEIYGFALPISFEAGFNYDIEAPEWLDVDRVNSEQIAIGKRGVCNVMAALDLNELAAETTTGKIEIYVRNSEEKVAEITVTFPSLDSYVSCDLNVAAITKEGKYVTYDAEGEATNNDACSFEVTTTSELTFVLAGLCSNNCWGASSNNEIPYAEMDDMGNPVNIATVDPGTRTGEGLLKTQNVSVEFTENAGAERVAYLLAMPSSEVSAFNKFVTDATDPGVELSEDFLKYVIVTFTQEGKAADDNALAATNAEMSLMESTNEMYNALSEVFGTTNIYVLNATSEFTLTYPSDVSPMIYRMNSTTGELEDGISDWTVDAGESMMTLSANKEVSCYIVLTRYTMGGGEEVMGVVSVTYVPAAGGEDSEAPFAFIESAPAGITLELAEDADIPSDYKTMVDSKNVYVLTLRGTQNWANLKAPSQPLWGMPFGDDGSSGTYWLKCESLGMDMISIEANASSEMSDFFLFGTSASDVDYILVCKYIPA